MLAERLAQGLTQRFKLGLEAVPNDVDFGVIRNSLHCDVRHTLIDEAMSDVSVYGLRRRYAAIDIGFFFLTFATIGEQVERITRTHDAGTGQC